MFTPCGDGEFDYPTLQRKLDQVKSTVFKRPDAAFFGPLMCSLDFIWSTQVDTAGTNGVQFYWNPKFFMEAPDRYSQPEFNNFVLMHELWHVARMHMLREGSRDKEIWNYACDIRINNDLVNAKYSFGTFPAWFRPDLDVQNKGPMAEEDIYDLLMKNAIIIPPSPWGNGDMIPDSNTKQQAVNNVVKAVQSAKMSGQPGAIPGNIEMIIDNFLSPIIPWQQHLYQWMSDLADEEFTWARPNRRYMGVE